MEYGGKRQGYSTTFSLIANPMSDITKYQFRRYFSPKFDFEIFSRGILIQTSCWTWGAAIG